MPNNGYTRKVKGREHDPSKIREMNSREIHCVEFLAGMDSQLHEHEKHMEDRLKSIKNGWRDYRLAMSMTERVLDAVYETMPLKTLRRFERLSELGEVVIRPKPAATAHAYVQIVENEDLKIIINRAIEGDCAMCMKFGGEVKACPLHRALMSVAAPEEIPNGGTCPYQHVTQESELGDYI